MKVRVLRGLIQHTALVWALIGGRLSAASTGLVFPCLSCSLVSGGCSGCFLRFLQGLASFVAGPVSFLSQEALGYLKSLLLLAVLVIPLGRWWCGWLCPFGLAQDWFRALGAIVWSRPRKLPARAVRILSALRYLLLIIILVVPALVDQGLIHPDFFFAYCRFCPAGTVLTMLAGQGGRLSLNAASTVSGVMSGLSLAMTGTVLGLTLSISRPWCNVCPMPLLFRAFRWNGLIGMRREPELCSRCGKCQKVCPVDGALDLEKNRFKGCLVCGRCLDNCPVPGCLKLTAGGLAISESHSQGTSVAG